ncbi:MAG: TadE/TadG family type IV pilus assembly protein [Pseudomonadota bacterium]
MIARTLANIDCADPSLIAEGVGSARGTSSRLKRFARALAKGQSGVALTEFAFVAPVFLAMGLMGTETSYYTITHMQVSQITMQVADNASRVGETDVLTARKVYEDDINGSLVGAEKAGNTINLFDRGRVIISSLQQNADGGQWIAWQRCRGAKNYDSAYGSEGTGAEGTSFPGMGETGAEITASPGTAVMFVEVAYNYEALTPFDWLDNEEIVYTAAFNVRDQRDLTQIYQTNPATGVADCNVYNADRP